jgi:hypothetical protein
VEIVNFVPPLWSSVPHVLTGLALKLPTHRLVRIDVGERLKKVWRPSPYCGGSCGRWRDRSWGRHGRIVLFVLLLCVVLLGGINTKFELTECCQRAVQK